MLTTTPNPNKNLIYLGKQGENLARQISFDELLLWSEEFGPGALQLLYQPYGEEPPYPVALDIADGLAVWHVTSRDTAAPGYGKCELRFSIGDIVVKSKTYRTLVADGVGVNAELPDGYENYLEQVAQAGAGSLEAASRAESAAKSVQAYAAAAELSAAQADASALAAAQAAEQAARVQAAADAANTEIHAVMDRAADCQTSAAASAQTACAQSKSAAVANANAQTFAQASETSRIAAETERRAAEAAADRVSAAELKFDEIFQTAATVKQELECTVESANAADTRLQAATADCSESAATLAQAVESAAAQTETVTAASQTAAEYSAALDAANSLADTNITALAEQNQNAHEILAGIEDIKAFLGYADGDMAGLQVDFVNKSFRRLAGSSGLSAGADFDQFAMFGGRRRCCVTNDGKITAWFGDDNYAEDGSMGQVMVFQPKFYYRVVPLQLDPISDGIGFHLRKANYYISPTLKPGFRLHPAFFDANGNEIEYILLSAYEGCIFDASANNGAGAYLINDEQIADFSEGGDALSSIAGVRPASGVSQLLTRQNLERLAQNRGPNWHNDLIKAMSANQLLMMVEMGTMDLQNAIGKGVVSLPDTTGVNLSVTTGGTTELGNVTGQPDGINGQTPVSYRGMENPWGNIWKFVGGLNIWGDGSLKGGIPYICSDFHFDDSLTSGNYESAGFTLCNTAGFISSFGYGSEKFDWLFLPSDIGNTAAPVGDYYHCSPNLNRSGAAIFGGNWATNISAGGFYWSAGNSLTYHTRVGGGRLVYIPTAR